MCAQALNHAVWLLSVTGSYIDVSNVFIVHDISRDSMAMLTYWHIAFCSSCVAHAAVICVQ